MNAASPTLPAVLSGLLSERGPGLVGDRRRLLGLLRDRLPGEVRAIRILMMAFDGGVPGRLSGTEPTPPDIGREGGLLAAETGLAPEVARRAVETWAIALCGYRPEGDADTGVSAPAGPRPQVRKLVQRIPAAGVAGAGSAAAAAPTAARPAAPAVAAVGAAPAAQPPKWRRSWPSLVLAAVIVIGAISRLSHQFSETPQPQPQQPAEPAKPGNAPPAEPAKPGNAPPAEPAKPGNAPPAEPAKPGNAPPDEPAAPAAPAAPGAAATPEGYPLITSDAPYPAYPTERIKQSPNTLGVYFGVKVDDVPVTYYVAFAFDKGQRQGRGLIMAVQKGQTASSGVITANRITDTGSGKPFLRVAGPLQQNPAGLPGLCAFAQVGDTLDRIDVVPGGLFVVFALDKDGGCNLQSRVGVGTLK